MSGKAERTEANPSPFTAQRALTEWLPLRIAETAPAVLVIGDVMLDGWWEGSIERLCREAPAPVVDVRHRTWAPGGAANTAMNLAALGARAALAGTTGCDAAGAELRRQLDAAGVDIRHLQEHPEMVTTTKTRLRSGGQMLVRFDDVAPSVPPACLSALAASLSGCIDDYDAVVLCDYGNGTLGGAVRRLLTDALSRRPGALLLLVDAHDPRPWADLHPDLATPNASEAATMLGLAQPDGGNRQDWAASHRDELLRATGAEAVVVTLDKEGTVLLPASGPAHRTWARPAAEKQASGAGDTFVAALAVGRTAGLPLSTSVDFAQAAADVAVRKPGTSVCGAEELGSYLGSFENSVIGSRDLARELALHRAEGRRIVLTNGCFDVLHRGHTRYLNQAKQLGDILVVALNSDHSVRRLKGDGRPINTVTDRAAVIAALSCVDFVTVFDDATAVPLIEELRPEVYAKGGDYSPEMLVETNAVERYGGRVSILDYVQDLSTTAVVNKIRGGAPAGQGENRAG